MDYGLHDKTVLITGASGGIGRAIATGFAAEGAHLALCCFNASDEANDLAADLRARYGTKSTVSRLDLGRLDSARCALADALQLNERIDVLINNAVRFGARASSSDHFDDIAEDAWIRCIRDNVEGAIQLTRLVAPIMRKERWGRIVHVSSRAAAMGMAGNEYYGAAKMALVGFNRSLSFSLGKAGSILTNVVEPGFTRTERNRGQGERMEKAIVAMTPVARLLSAEDVALPIVYLGSAANTGITGQVIAVSGGL